MKLLLDENLSRRLVPALQARFPGSGQIALPIVDVKAAYRRAEAAP